MQRKLVEVRPCADPHLCSKNVSVSCRSRLPCTFSFLSTISIVKPSRGFPFSTALETLPVSPSELTGKSHPPECRQKPIPPEGDVSSVPSEPGPACSRKEGRLRILPPCRLSAKSFLSAQPLPRSEPYGWCWNWTYPNERTLLAGKTIDKVGSFKLHSARGHVAAAAR
jgi:hypothetical protein